MTCKGDSRSCESNTSSDLAVIYSHIAEQVAFNIDYIGDCIQHREVYRAIKHRPVKHAVASRGQY